MEDNATIIKKLWDECMAYPPNLKRIENTLNGLSDISVLYSAYGAEDDPDYIYHRNDFLSYFLDEYMLNINKDWFGYYEYDSEIKGWKFIPPVEPLPKIKRETFAVNIVKLFLDHGYDPKACGGKVGTSCLDALVWSHFNNELVKVASLLIKAGADPSLTDEEGDSVPDIIDFHRSGTDWYYEGIEEDDYLDNRLALDSYYDLCMEKME